MHADMLTINLRNILLIQLLLLSIMTLAGTMPVIQQELLKIWKTFKTPVLPIKPTRTNHKSNKFWEIDMTKFEP